MGRPAPFWTAPRPDRCLAGSGHRSPAHRLCQPFGDPGPPVRHRVALGRPAGRGSSSPGSAMTGVAGQAEDLGLTERHIPQEARGTASTVIAALAVVSVLNY